MKPKLLLDYDAILANSPAPVHFVLQFTAPAISEKKSDPLAFAIVLDKSGSMEGAPIANAKRAAQMVVRHLRKHDLFSLVVFDDNARAVVPLQQVANRQAVLKQIAGIEADGCTNLTGGWMLAHDGLKAAPAGALRRALLLSDGELNVGIVDPIQVCSIVTEGLTHDLVRTSTLGFGANYNEDLLAGIAQATNGAFHDANSADKLPGIFAEELGGLQRISVQNLRVRIKPLNFVERCACLGGFPSTTLPDGRQEFALGDLVSEEEAIAIFALDVMPIPLLAPNRPAASLEGEALVELEILFDEISDEGVRSLTWQQTVRVRAVADLADLKLNEEVLPWISAQEAAKILEDAIALRDKGNAAEALKLIDDGIQRLRSFGNPAKTADGLQLLETFRPQITLQDAAYVSVRKRATYSSSSYRRMHSKQHWTAGEAMPAPSFIKAATASGKAPSPGDPLPPPADQS
jgi:Ca-activated chloride channel family protein